MQQIIPCLWFNGNAEQAVNFYLSVFKDSKIGTTTYYDEASSKASGQPLGSVLTIIFELNGQSFMALNGGPAFRFTEAVSFMIYCKNQEEIDYYWANLSSGGQEGPCGWLKDQFGLSWQVVPAKWESLMAGKDPVKSERAMRAMMQMGKLDIRKLEEAYDGK